MIFTSNIFLFLFLPLYLLMYFGSKASWRSLIIVLGSYSFYAWWRPDFLFLFIGITYWNYLFGLKIHKLRDVNQKAAYRWLVIGVVGNLATLGYFKYANFGAEVLTNALGQFGVNTFTLEYIILPLGISFYVFQALSYIVDIYRKEAEPTHRFVDFAAFISLFPQLIAGPILRYQLIEKQLQQRTHSWELFSLGACRFMQGFTKKVLIADSIAPLNSYIMNVSEPSLLDAWIGCLASIVQLYFDFSGYSDMAIGLGMMMGFRFAENFNQPFLAMSLTEFWRRWHLTLSEFLRDYVYIPILKSGLVAAALASFLTMLLSGLWHGASFSFIFFGMYYGTFLVIEKKLGIATNLTTPYSLTRNLIAVTFVVLSMPLFITGNTAHSLDIYAGAFGMNGFGSISPMILGTSKMTLAFLVIGLLWIVITSIINRRFYSLKQESYFMSHVSGYQAIFLWCGFLLAVSKLSASSFSPFLYFQF